jgi:hypothetical protein
VDVETVLHRLLEEVCHEPAQVAPGVDWLEVWRLDHQVRAHGGQRPPPIAGEEPGARAREASVGVIIDQVEAEEAAIAGPNEHPGAKLVLVAGQREPTHDGESQVVNRHASP